MDHLLYDDNLFDFMKSLIPFNIVSTNPAINEHVLKGGLEKNQWLNIHFNDVVGKRELCMELILNAILPKEWSFECGGEQGRDSMMAAQ